MLRQYVLAAGLVITMLASRWANGAEALRTMPHHSTAMPLSHTPLVAPPGPPYLLLNQAHTGTGVPVTGRPYAYGWFGVAPRRHTITHQGYYGSHWLMPGRLAP